MKAKKPCTSGRCATPKSVKIATYADATMFLSRRRRKANRIRKRYFPTDRERALLSSLDVIGVPPGQTSPCAPLFVAWMLKLAEADAYEDAYLNCIANQPPPPIEV